MSPYERVSNRLTLILFISLIGLSVAGAVFLPGPIAVHYDLEGHPNRWGNPATLLILPFVSFFIIGILRAVENVHPDLMNFPGPRTPENITRQIRNTRQMLATLRVLFMSIFLALQSQGIWANLYHQDRLLGWTLPLVLIPLLVIPGVFVWRAYRLVPRE